MLIYKLPKLSEYIIDFRLDPIADRVTFASYNHKIESRRFEIVIEPEHKITNEWALVYVNDLIYVCKVQQTLLLNKYIFSIDDKMSALYYGLWETIFDIDLKYFYWPNNTLKYTEKYSKEVKNHFFGDVEIPRKLLDIQEQTRYIGSAVIFDNQIGDISFFLKYTADNKVVIDDTDENVIIEPVNDYSANIKYKNRNYYFSGAIVNNSVETIYNLVMLVKKKDVEGLDYNFYAFPATNFTASSVHIVIDGTLYLLRNNITTLINLCQNKTFLTQYEVVGFFNAPPFYLINHIRNISDTSNIYKLGGDNYYFYNINTPMWLPKLVLTNRTGGMIIDTPGAYIKYEPSYKPYDYTLTEPSTHYRTIKWQSLEIRDNHLKFKKKQGRLLYAEGLKLVIDEVTIIDYGMDLNFPISNEVRKEYLNIKNAYNTQVQSDAISFFTNPMKAIGNPVGTLSNANLIQATHKMQNAQKMNLLNTKANIESTNIEALRLLYNYTTPSYHAMVVTNERIEVFNTCFVNSMVYPFEVNNYDSINVNSDINNEKDYELWNPNLFADYGYPIDVFFPRRLTDEFSNEIKFFLKINDYNLRRVNLVDKYPNINHIENARTIFFENIQNGFFTWFYDKPNFKEIELSENKK